MFETWTNVIGGILEEVGIEGFLDNLGDLYDETDAETEMWSDFVKVWWDEYADTARGVAELNKLCGEHGLMEEVRGGDSDRSQETKLGTHLRRHRDGVFAGLQIKSLDKKRKGKRYKLVRIDKGCWGSVKIGTGGGTSTSEGSPAEMSTIPDKSAIAASDPD